MEDTLIEAFSTIAEVSVGLAGFAGVAVMLGGGPGRWTPADEVRIRALLGSAFGALFASLVPVGLLLGPVADQAAIRCGAAALLLVIVLFVAHMRRSLDALDPAAREVLNPAVARTIAALLALVAAAQLGTAIGFTGSAGPATLFFGLLVLVGYAAFGFVRLMFVRPSE